MELVLSNVTKFATKTSNKPYWIATINNGPKVKIWDEALLTMQLTTESVVVIQKPSSIVDGKPFHHLPVMRLRSNARALEAMGIEVYRPKPE